MVSLIAAGALAVVASGTRVLEGRRRVQAPAGLFRGVCATFACVLFAMAVRVYLWRFALVYADHTIFTGIGYTDAHVSLNGWLIVATLYSSAR